MEEPKPFVIAISETQRDKFSKQDYIPTHELVRLIEGLSVRMIYYWESSGVFGTPTNAGQGYRILWDRSIIPIVRILVELSINFQSKIDILKLVVDNYTVGHIQLSQNVQLTWNVPMTPSTTKD